LSIDFDQEGIDTENLVSSVLSLAGLEGKEDEAYWGVILNSVKRGTMDLSYDPVTGNAFSIDNMKVDELLQHIADVSKAIEVRVFCENEGSFLNDHSHIVTKPARCGEPICEATGIY